jgi:hypothetical protein
MAFERSGFEVDMRDYKSKMRNCPITSCRYGKKKKGEKSEKFSHPVQREVDTAIAIRPLITLFS